MPSEYNGSALCSLAQGGFGLGGVGLVEGGEGDALGGVTVALLYQLQGFLTRAQVRAYG